MAQALVISGGSIFLLLGVLHGILTLRDLRNPRTFTPRDPELRRAMQRSSIAIHPATNLWKAWMGFNFSHSLGLMLFGGAFLYVGVFVPAAFAESPLLQGCAVGVSAIYLVLSLLFWFSKPAVGSGLALACFILAAIQAYA
ncbi:MAG TPA: hypothetical protein VF647_09140 [Longimicrobium sp.]|jgi:hypothetical protein